MTYRFRYDVGKKSIQAGAVLQVETESAGTSTNLLVGRCEEGTCEAWDHPHHGTMFSFTVCAAVELDYLWKRWISVRRRSA